MSSTWHRQSFRATGLLVAATGAIANLMIALPAQSLEFPSTSNRGAPSRTLGGGVRGNTCSAAPKTNFTVLIPQNNINTTISDSPTLFFYIPVVNSTSAELLLMDDQGNDLYSTMVTLPKTGGIIQVSLPEKTKSGQPLLAPNKDYTWRFAIVCDEKERTRDLPLNGIVRRVSLKPDVQAALKTAQTDPLRQAEIYAKAGIWQETLVKAAASRDRNPDVWEGLLKSVGLQAIAKAKFAECCKPMN